MSLFPAYAEISQDVNDHQTTVVSDKEWLTNNSFAVSFPFESKDTDIIEIKDSPPRPKKRKKEKKKHKKKEKSIILEKVKEHDIQVNENDCFVIDKEQQLSYLTVNTLTRPLKPRYNVKLLGLVPRHLFQKNVKVKRYFKSHDKSEGCKEGTLEEESLVSKKTEEFNKKLAEDPHDIQSWVDFVNFQDEFHKYQHIKYRSMIERERAAAHHKLSILDKAVAQNPDNKKLQALWLKIGISVLPSEEMSNRIDKILEESGGTMTLWLGLMTTTQHSLALCTVPSVTKLYEKLLVNFQKVKQPDVYRRDFHVLELLFHYGRFLDHCGHWELLWLMVKVNLQFNAKIELNFDLKVDDKVKELENAVLEKEKQAVWQMWSQLERIREGYHFLPDAESVDYPQRCVSPENVINFTWHFHPNIHFQLVVTFIMMLKVPLLQATNTTLKFLIPNALPWVFDSPEYVLSSVLASPAINLQYGYLRPITQLSRGPQYLRKFHGQMEFFNTINDTFSACLKCMEGRQRTALGVWWLRYERWIHLLNKLRLGTVPDDRKTAKNFFKDFLKLQENRDSLLFYIEYSLLEYNLGNTETCIKTLKTLISSRTPVLSISTSDEKSALMSAYKILVEVFIGANRKKEALDLVINLGNGTAADARVTIHCLASAEKKFDSVIKEAIPKLDSNSCLLEDLLMPQFMIDWISCYFWLIALVKTPSELKKCYEEIFKLLENVEGAVAEQTRECLWETITTIIWVFERSNFSHIKEILKSSLASFPHNLKFLSYMANADLEVNTYWWSLKRNFLINPNVFSCIFLISIALDKYQKDKENFHNRLKNLLQSLALREGKLFAMIHGLRLRFLYENENSHLEVAQLQALEACPWNKSIYMESILLLPAKLMQLTDVLIEKELKIHITPDEIQEMRD